MKTLNPFNIKSKYYLVELKNDKYLVLENSRVDPDDGYCYDMYHEKLIVPIENKEATINQSDFFIKIIATIGFELENILRIN